MLLVSIVENNKKRKKNIQIIFNNPRYSIIPRSAPDPKSQKK